MSARDNTECTVCKSRVLFLHPARQGYLVIQFDGHEDDMLSRIICATRTCEYRRTQINEKPQYSNNAL